MLRKTSAMLTLLSVCILVTACQPDSSLSELKKGSDTYDQLGDPQYDIVDRGPVRGGVLNLFSTTPDSLNPVLTGNSYVSDFLSLVYEGLVKLDENQQPIPVLSDSWDVSPDGTVWNFHIRKGVSWHDGEPFTAADVQFTMEYILNSNNNSVYKALLDNVATYAAIDASNLKMVLRKPNSFTAEMMTFPILPRHQFENAVNPDSKFRPIGTGPYKYNSRDDKKIVITSDENWWYLKTQPDKADTMMYINEIDLKLYKTADDEMGAFQRGDIDVSCINSGEFSRYSGRTDLIMHKYISRDFEFLSFNLNNPIFQDPSVRNAIDTSIDRKLVISNALKGGAVEADLPLMPGSWFSEAGAPDSTVPLKANDILLSGGWKNDTAGYYKRINGARKYLSFEILVNSNNAARVGAARNISDQLNAAGIKAVCTSLDWKDLISRINSRKFDMVYLGVKVGKVPDISYLYSNAYLASYNASGGEIARNISGYSNISLDSIITRIFSENDPLIKKGLFNDLKHQISADKPYIGLYFLQNAVIYRKGLRGSISPYVWNRLNDVTLWYKAELQ